MTSSRPQIPRTKLSSEPPSDAAIAAFWAWFVSVAEQLSKDFANQQLLNLLDEQVAHLGEVSWEIGPGVQAQNALIITPDGSKEWLATTQRIIGRAPVIPTWELHWARPPKRWNLEFTLGTSIGQICVDAKPWRYVLFRFPDNSFDIVIEQNNLEIPDGDRYSASVIVLDGILGEHLRLELFVEVDSLETFPPQQASKATRITNLADHINALRLVPKGS